MIKKRVVPILNCIEGESSILSELEPGVKVRAMLNYELLEKTRNFSILKINHVHIIRSQRRF